MSDDMNHDPLKSLGELKAPAPSERARERALGAGMAAFEAAKTRETKKSAAATQGTGWGRRLTSIIASLKGNWIMDLRLPIGTAAIALLILPLGYQLYTTTSMTPAQGRATGPAEIIAPPPEPAPATAEAPAANLQASQPAPVPMLAEESRANAPAAKQEMAPMRDALAQGGAGADTDFEAAPMAQDNAASAQRPAPAFGATTEGYADLMAEPGLPSIIMTQPVEPSGDQFTPFDESRLKVVADEPVSTFSIDVDTASYSYVRRQIEDGFLPESDAVRIEEMINYFPYDYAAPEMAEVPFEPIMAVYPTPWNSKTQLLHIGIKGYVPPMGEDRPSNLVFLIDTSGSMDEPDKLPLLKRAFGLMVDQLSANDRVSIVVYAGSAGVVLEPTAATDKAKILGALDRLGAGGSTAGAEGIELAYRLAEEGRIEGGTNRVILATDGDFNVGIADPEQLEDFIKAKRDSGVTLSVLGFGRGNLDDATMQALAQNGNGNASYIANFREAQKVLVEEGGSTLQMIAKDVKIQVEFNPAVVAEYRLIGYETRALKREDFNNDAVDAGDIGAGHSVTALYEITPVGSGAQMVDPLRYGGEGAAGSGDEIGFLKMRYKLPDEDVSRLIEVPVTPELVHGDIADVGDDMRFAAAVAAFGQKLKGSSYGAMSWDAIAALAQSGRGADEGGYRAEFMQVLKTAALLKPDTCAGEGCR
jgi:Ca-activated chloride channel homolog